MKANTKALVNDVIRKALKGLLVGAAPLWRAWLGKSFRQRSNDSKKENALTKILQQQQELLQTKILQQQQKVIANKDTSATTKSYCKQRYFSNNKKLLQTKILQQQQKVIANKDTSATTKSYCKQRYFSNNKKLLQTKIC